MSRYLIACSRFKLLKLLRIVSMAAGVRARSPALVALMGFLFAPIVVAVEPATRVVDFKNDLIPVFTKLGCNAGACHGSAAGRGGFKLSLYGGDPAADYAAVAQQWEGRRINLRQPSESLILLKPMEALAHGGGHLIEDHDTSCQILTAWIAQGAQYAPRTQLQQVEVTPRHWVASVGEKIPVAVKAFYQDGSARDVSQWAVLTPEDATAVNVDGTTNQLTIQRRGRHVVVARFLSEVVPIEILVPGNSPVAATNYTTSNFIDAEIMSTLAKLGLPASPGCDDATFRRRVTLHLTGRLPVPTEGTDTALERSVLVDELLNSEAFIEYWTLQLAKWLRLRAQPNDTTGIAVYHAWLKQQLRDSVGYDALARELLLATGDSHQYGPANFYRTTADPRAQAEFVSELFMGSRLRCANCHNHPLDRWTQDDYHGLAAIFAKLDPGPVVRLKTNGEVIHPQTLEPATARIPGEYYLDAAVADGRQQFAQWLTRNDNPYFAKAIVNRLWKQLMGRGLVEPVDDFRATNPATHPDLLNQLADDFVASGYDLKHTLKLIAGTEAYARSSLPLPENQDDEHFYSHAKRTRMEAEVLADAIADVLGSSERYGDLPLGTRAVAVIDPQTPSASLDILGRCGRNESCEDSGHTTAGLPQMLHLFNGEFLNARIEAAGGRLDLLLAAGYQPSEIVAKFYQLALARQPSQLEENYWQQQLDALRCDSPEELAERRRELLADFVWSLLTCEEFVTNH